MRQQFSSFLLHFWGHFFGCPCLNATISHIFLPELYFFSFCNFFFFTFFYFMPTEIQVELLQSFLIFMQLNNLSTFVIEKGAKQHNSIHKKIFLNVVSFPFVSNKVFHICIGSICATLSYFHV